MYSTGDYSFKIFPCFFSIFLTVMSIIAHVVVSADVAYGTAVICTAAA